MMDQTETQNPRRSQTGKLVSEMTASEARAFFLRQTSYTTIELPVYFDFETVLQRVAKVLPSVTEKNWSRKARNSSNANYVLQDNKDGRLAWRPLTLIHPALYVSLVHTMTREDNWDAITRRLQEFRDIPTIHCASMPREYVAYSPLETDPASADSDPAVTTGPFGAAMSQAWYNEMEQTSLELSTTFKVMLQADIANCYSSIYTHTIPWALHGKEKAKTDRNSLDLIGNLIDRGIQDIMQGQTKGIPQGSELMNFIAEIVLGYGDEILRQRLEAARVFHYKVLRFKDDYRILTQNRADAETALGVLYETLQFVQLDLRMDKTYFSEDITESAVNADKVQWIMDGYQERMASSNESPNNLLVQLRDFNSQHPNSGMVKRGITALREHHQQSPDQWHQLLMPSVEMLTDIGLSNPKVYPMLAPFLGELIENHDEDERILAVAYILERLTDAPHSGRIELWVQRIGFFGDQLGQFGERLCKLVMESDDVALWNSSWLSNNRLREAIEQCDLIDRDKLAGIPPTLTDEEWDLLAWRTLGYE